MKMLGPLCNQTVYLETDAKTLYYSLLPLFSLTYMTNKVCMYVCMYVKHKKDYASLRNRNRNFTNRFYSTKKTSNGLIVLCILWDASHE